jgi:hypothetical protein
MKINIIEKYHSMAMRRIALWLKAGLVELGEVVVSDSFDPNADVNYHLPWHFILEESSGVNVIFYTHHHKRLGAEVAKACHLADKVICMSFHGRKELISLGVKPEKIWVSYCGTDGFGATRKNIGVVGAVQPDGRKREHLLVDIAFALDSMELDMTNFVIVGRGWEDTIDKLKRHDVSVSYFPDVEDAKLIELYGAMDVLLVTGELEGGPMTVLEALRSGVPVIAPEVGYAADFLHETYNSFEYLLSQVKRFLRPSIENVRLGALFTWRAFIQDQALVIASLVNAECDPKNPSATGRYKQLFDAIDEHKPKSICEIGTWNGHSAVQMIQRMAQYMPIEDVKYTGFDLFELATPTHMISEFSKVPPPVDIVRRRIDATGADIRLWAGETKDTLVNIPDADMYFIDGGHSEETIANDWKHVSETMKNHAVVIFDDYYFEGKPDGMGCNSLVDNLSPMWEVEKLPFMSEVLYDEKPLGIGMVKVTYA